MSDFDYQSLALRTKPNPAQYQPVPPQFIRIAMDAVNALRALDAIKKNFAYGKELPPQIAQMDVSILPQGEIDGDVFHAILGLATEAGELLEAALATIANGEPFDMVNFLEELGDGGWYHAIGTAAGGQTIEQNNRQNIAKLLARFPDKFDANLAINRDTDAERVVLEATTRTIEVPDDPNYLARLQSNQRNVGRAEELFNTEAREAFDAENTARVGSECRIYQAELYTQAGEDFIRGVNCVGDPMNSTGIELWPFVADDDYEGKYRGMLLVTDKAELYRIVGPIKDRR